MIPSHWKLASNTWICGEHKCSVCNCLVTWKMHLSSDLAISTPRSIPLDCSDSQHSHLPLHPSGDIWQCLEAFWLLLLEACYRHPVSRVPGCCWTTYNTQVSLTKEKKILVQHVSKVKTQKVLSDKSTLLKEMDLSCHLCNILKTEGYLRELVAKINTIIPLLYPSPCKVPSHTD